MTRPRHPLEGPSPEEEEELKQEKARVRVDVRFEVASPRPFITYSLIAINIALYFISQLIPEMFLWGALFPVAVLEDLQLQRLLTAMFLHANLPHILLNMIALYTLGRELEMLHGSQRFIAIYFLGGLAGSIVSAGIGNYAIPSVGASGAVLAVWGAQMVFLYRNRELFGAQRIRQVLLQNFAYLAAFTFIGFVPGSRVDNWAHIGGFLGGTVVAWLVPVTLRYVKAPYRIDERQPSAAISGTVVDVNPWSNAMIPTLLAVGAGLAGLLLLAMVGFQIGLFPTTL